MKQITLSSETEENAELELNYKQDLSQAKNYWLAGDWEKLSEFDPKDIEKHPERGYFVLLIASAHQQLGNIDKTEQYAHQAISWQCSPKLVAKILVAGIHNILGRAAILKQDENRISHHLEIAVNASFGNELVKSTQYHTRLTKELKNLNISQESDISNKTITECLAVMEPKKKILNINSLELDNIKRTSPTIIVIAGMRHSGSTALFNIVRLSLLVKQINFFSGYTEQTNLAHAICENVDIILLKTHEIRDDIYKCADVILTTRRDIRNTVASAMRRDFPLLKNLGSATEYAKYNRMLHDIWLKFSHYEFIYENFINDPLSSISYILDILGLSNVSARHIYSLLVDLPLNDYKNTLLSPSHITDPERKLSYVDTLDGEVIQKIEHHHQDWLKKYNYPTLELVKTKDKSSNFVLGIGAAKCGTTTLSSLLAQHPEINLSKIGKEVHFFDEKYSQGKSWYMNLFDSNSHINLDFTPSYLFDPSCRDRIFDVLGENVKFIVILRNPIERAYAHYCHAVNQWGKSKYRALNYPQETLPFYEALLAEDDRLRSGQYHIRHQSYYNKGLYDKQLCYFFSKFPKESFFIIIFEEFIQNHKAILSSIYRWLNIDTEFSENQELVKLNSQSQGSIPKDAFNFLSSTYSESIKNLEAILNKDLSIWKIKNE